MQLSTRQAEIAEYVARGMANKEISRETGLSLHTVDFHIREAAARLPGHSWPRHKLTLWWFDTHAGDPAPEIDPTTPNRGD